MRMDIRGGDGNPGDDVMAQGQSYLANVSQAVQGRALVSGLRAYIAVVRKAAQAAASSSAFRSTSGYRSGARLSRPGMVTGFLYSGGYGNIIEAGAAGHWAPIADTIGASGNTQPGLGQWLRINAPELLRAWGDTARFAKVKTRSGTPWVIPAFAAAEGAAADAFQDAMLNQVAKEVK